MNILISGATGFIGTKLKKYLSENGFNVDAISRETLHDTHALRDAVKDADVVINLAGATIAKRWTPGYKHQILSSRVDSTHALVEAINSTGGELTFICASAVGIYSEVGEHDEDSHDYNNDFLSSVCQRWESEALKVREGVRLVITRFGVVLAPDGGMIKQLLPMVKRGFGIVFGSGRAQLSWIDRDDLCRAFEFLIHNTNISGVVNLVAPNVSTQEEITAKLLHTVYKGMPVMYLPPFLPRLILGERAQLILHGQCAIPKKLMEAGFEFETAHIDDYFAKTDRAKSVKTAPAI